MKRRMRFRHTPRWAAVLSIALCLPLIASCATTPPNNPAPAGPIEPAPIEPAPIEPVPVKPDDLYGSYMFQKLVYMNPLSSFLPQDGYRISYTLAPDSLKITDENGGERSEAITYSGTVVDKGSFESQFIESPFETPDISGYTETYQYDLTAASASERGWRLYLMDEEIWIASTTEQYVWSIYRVVRYDDILPEVTGYLESKGRSRTTSCLNSPRMRLVTGTCSLAMRATAVSRKSPMASCANTDDTLRT